MYGSKNIFLHFHGMTAKLNFSPSNDDNKKRLVQLIPGVPP
jgi:hypothetical protein